jgi:dTDP-4-dehydrorhamnose reductase
VNVVIIGRNGQVARALARLAGGQDHAVSTIGRPEFDLEHPENLPSLLAPLRPDVVINAAAYTAVDRAEAEAERAFAVNAAGAGAVSRAAAEAGAAIVHLSTDYVFSGEKAEPYVEDDPTAPRSVYGASKLEGERLVLAANPRAIVVRTSWVYDASGANFVRTMLRLARSRSSLSVVHDQLGQPTYAVDLAAALLVLAAAAQRAPAPNVVHCAGTGETSWATFATTIFEQSRTRGGPAAEVVPIGSKDYPTAAARPKNSRLNCSRLYDQYGVRIRPWQEALSECLDEIAADGWRME